MRILGHYVSRRILALLGLELVAIYIALYLTLALFALSLGPVDPWMPELLIAVAVVLFAVMLVGLYEQECLATFSLRSAVVRLGGALILAGGTLAIYGLLTASSVLTPTIVGSGAVILLASLTAERSLFRGLSETDAFKRRILVLGTGSRARSLEVRHAGPDGGDATYQVVGYVATERETDRLVDQQRLRVLDDKTSLLDVARSLRVEEIVVGMRERRENLPVNQLLECKLNGIRITDLSTFFEREDRQLQLDGINTSWLVFGEGFRQHRARAVVKRSFDLLASTALLVATLPVMLLTAIAIKLDSPGPVLYWQTRVGQGNTPFEICKFRSMRSDAEGDGVARWASGDDDRITRVGRVIRKLRIDELPQIINVFQGRMSFVGPRPERPVFVEQLSEEIPYFLARHSIRPGITGWAQVRYAYGASVEDARQKLQYDLYYVKNHSLFMDLMILFETVRVVLFGRGAR
ncbi:MULTISPECIES: TIGR03013 family XrtA/PEP-CTERM system glycosyltransferase [unclassified Thioalkalivibrio]|uniref:TIGR03013 family XrtA/PEP-CTERM system glycosyltransferase n=1 Tax=unclassified Thioalkalivibrio TaxID=2621013 RepID=UPI0003811B10|nr:MULTISPECIES: TIGR03013 family XrtA/PEP-CTERM system glycosyltransferase [unclassified Thioalkalivibrio]